MCNDSVKSTANLLLFFRISATCAHLFTPLFKKHNFCLSKA